jgi:catechol 2,3-dioxygenase-like lactoylglutathione lyase family enzyme
MKLRWNLFPALACVLYGALVSTAAAQPPAGNAGINGIAHIAFRVSDLDREIAFLGKLGYEESFAITNGTKTMEVFIKVNDRQFIELYPRTDPSQPLGWMHVCFEAGDLNALIKYYNSIGLKAAPVRKAAAGNLISSMTDAEGRVTEFTQYMPGSRHTNDRGQHLGANRISDELMGFTLPVKDGAAEKEFFSDLGLEAQAVNGNVRLTVPAAPDLILELRPSHPGAVPEFLFPVPDARRAGDELKDAGVRFDRDGKLLFVHDPDSNVFVFLDTGRK